MLSIVLLAICVPRTLECAPYGEAAECRPPAGTVGDDGVAYGEGVEYKLPVTSLVPVAGTLLV